MSNDYYQSLPRKRTGTGVLFFDQDDNILLVNPNYKDHWLLPGGVVEDNESPRGAAVREVKEELGLDIDLPKFLSVDYYGNTDNLKGEAVQFLFDGGILNDEIIQQIKLQESELDEYKFVTVSEACKMVSVGMSKRLPKAIEARDNQVPVYLEEAQ